MQNAIHGCILFFQEMISRTDFFCMKKKERYPKPFFAFHSHRISKDGHSTAILQSSDIVSVTKINEKLLLKQSYKLLKGVLRWWWENWKKTDYFTCWVNSQTNLKIFFLKHLFIINLLLNVYVLSLGEKIFRPKQESKTGILFLDTVYIMYI